MARRPLLPANIVSPTPGHLRSRNRSGGYEPSDSRQGNVSLS